MRSSSFNFVRINMKHLLYSIQKAYMFISSLILLAYNKLIGQEKKTEKNAYLRRYRHFVRKWF